MHVICSIDINILRCRLCVWTVKSWSLAKHRNTVLRSCGVEDFAGFLWQISGPSTSKFKLICQQSCDKQVMLKFCTSHWLLIKRFLICNPFHCITWGREMIKYCDFLPPDIAVWHCGLQDEAKYKYSNIVFQNEKTTHYYCVRMFYYRLRTIRLCWWNQSWQVQEVELNKFYSSAKSFSSGPQCLTEESCMTRFTTWNKCTTNYYK